MENERNISAFRAFIESRCPRCRKGKMFSHKAYDLRNYQKMNVYCTECGLRYELELGFFWGAMYVSYMMNVALCVSLGVATYYLLNDPAVWVYILIIVGAIILFSPLTFRYARVMFLHLFSPIHFDENAIFKHLHRKTKDPNLN